ncbi:hypothetical protein HPB51_010539 [Rhipicephalus microplus]|uniref:Uncharacterized protein n=1 Tax=Rhipicephalus microplus TaxID=6941 RepID=A0A9J6D9F9_RHIMP|nr:hypothetical protein HPB51_010539 [Rhipicephalus microplus]
MDQDEQVIVVAWSENEKTMGKELTFSAVFTLNSGLQHINRKSVKKLPKHMKVPLTSAKSTTVQEWRSCARPALQKQLVHNRAKRPPLAPLFFTKTRNLISSLAEKDMLTNSVSTRQYQQQQASRALVAPSGSALTPSAASRRCNKVVKEVDRMKKQRQKQSVRQLRQIEEKRERMNVDPGNPNSEFLSMLREYRVTLDLRPLLMGDACEVHKICVAVRKRPLKRGVNQKEVDIITVPNRDLSHRCSRTKTKGPPHEVLGKFKILIR